MGIQCQIACVMKIESQITSAMASRNKIANTIATIMMIENESASMNESEIASKTKTKLDWPLRKKQCSKFGEKRPIRKVRSEQTVRI